MIDTYYFDSYALIEIIKNNPRFKKYSECEIKLNSLNLYELYKKLLEDNTPKIKAENYLLLLTNKLEEINYEDIINSVELKLTNPKLSIPDCFGYVMAKRLKIKFLTGDKEFRNMDNVEFVTK